MFPTEIKKSNGYKLLRKLEDKLDKKRLSLSLVVSLQT